MGGGKGIWRKELNLLNLPHPPIIQRMKWGGGRVNLTLWNPQLVKKKTKVSIPFWHPPTVDDAELMVGEAEVDRYLWHPDPHLGCPSVAAVFHL